jgi:hypothetical protein
MAPEYQRELYVEVSGARYLGYESSVINIGAALAAIRRSGTEERYNYPSTLTSEGKPKTDEETRLGGYL